MNIWMNSVLTFRVEDGRKPAIRLFLKLDGWYHYPDGQRWKYLEQPTLKDGKEISKEFMSSIAEMYTRGDIKMRTSTAMEE